MKLTSFATLLLADVLLGICPLVVVAAEAPKVEQPRPTSAGLISTAYRALVSQSIVPADPRVVANAALTAIATGTADRAQPLPAAFGADPEQDSAWLAARGAGLSPPWSVIDAMARATGTAHVSLATPQRRQGIRALGTGQPLAAPGFNLYPLADGRLVVFDVIKGASAEISGLRAGDVLRRINGEQALRVDHFLINALPAGTELALEIERANQPVALTLRLVPGVVSPVESRLLADQVGYVRFRWFARSEDPERDTATLARQAFAALAAQDARGLVLDLRSALGGSGEVRIVSALCGGDTIYAIRQPLSAPARPVKREGARCWSDRPIVVLVNEHTVSAGEALALAVRELAHAKIVGRMTGGGLTEFSVVPLADGHGLTIPTGVVLGPVSGGVQAGHAIKPDLEVPNPEIADLIGGHDNQLEVARGLLERAN